MRILQALEATLGGTARHVLDLCLGLRKQGHDVHLLYNPRPGRMDGLFSGGLDALRDAEVVLVPLEMERSVGFRDATAVRRMRGYIRDRGPFDILHGHSSKAGAVARLAGLGLPGRRVYTPHAFMTANPELGSGGRHAYGTAERILGLAAHALICVSEDEREHALRLGIPGRKLHVVTNGTDVAPPRGDRRYRRADYALPEDAVVVGYVGRLVPQKDPANLLEAFALAARKLPRLRLAIVGTGPLEGSARDAASKLGVSDRVHWLGVLDGPAAMELFDIFALPSRYEGLPYVLIEAMAKGLPIATTAIGGASALIEESGNGHIVPVARPELLGAALVRLGSDSDLRAAMSRRSLERSRRFTTESMVASILDVYRTV